VTSACPSSSPPTPSPISNSTNHSTNIPAIVGGVVGGLFVMVVAITLTLIYVFLLQTSNQIRRRRRTRFVGLFILAFYVSKLIFYSRVKISSPFYLRKTCWCCHISSFENKNLGKKKHTILTTSV
jgi:hypothetical protein